MTIKRAFLTFAALMLIPGFAMAQSTTTFDTAVVWVGLAEVNPPDNLKPAPLTATRVCNSGVDLEQSFPNLGPDAGDTVQFQVNDFADAAGNYCEISITGVGDNSFVAAVNTGSGAVSATSCRYVSSADTPAAGETTIVAGGSNSCTFIVAPPLVEMTLIKEWDFNGNSASEVAEYATIDFFCNNIVRQNNLMIYPGNYSWYNIPIEEESDPDDYLVLPPQGADGNFWHVLPFVEKTARTNCYANENVFDSSVESDGGCAGPNYLDAANPTGSCTITNTVFFEGIPTLSQYGMAIMALLMLGIGFVGFRRFV